MTLSAGQFVAKVTIDADGKYVLVEDEAQRVFEVVYTEQKDWSVIDLHVRTLVKALLNPVV